MNFIKTLTADNTTAELAWESLGVTRSQMLAGVNDVKKVRDKKFNWTLGEHKPTDKQEEKFIRSGKERLTSGTHGHHEGCN